MLAETFIGMDKIQLGNLRQRCAVELPNMIAPRRDFVVPLFFGPEIGKDQKKGLRRKSSGFSVQKQVKTKKKVFAV